MGEFGRGSEVSDTSEGITEKVPSLEPKVPPKELSPRGKRAMQGIKEEEAVIPQEQGVKGAERPTNPDTGATTALSEAGKSSVQGK